MAGVSYLSISLPRLAVAGLLVVIAALLARRQRVGIEGTLLFASVRGAVQLLAIGYALRFLFAHEHWASVFAVLLVMLFAAAYTASRRVEHGPRSLFSPALAAIALGGGVALLPVFAFVITPTPWWNGRFVIPVAGIILSNTMNTTALVLERVFASAHAEAALIEQLLALGASPEQATERSVRAAVRAGMTPTINSLLTVGLVALPGMMTGQIVSGVSPESAVRWQIVVLYQLAAASTVAGVAAAALARRMLFTARAQLVLPRNAP